MELIEDKKDNLVLTTEQEHELCKSLKVAMLKQMHHRGLLTDMQLNTLIKMQQ